MTPPAALDIELRQAHPGDLPQVYDITEAAMRGYVEAAFGPWQREFQYAVISQSFDPATHRFIHLAGVLAGVIAAGEYGEHIQLEKLYLLPQFQGQGIGSQVMQQLLQAATQQHKAVRLRVLAVNSAARRFYARHGFVVTECTLTRYFMQYSA
jgi:GNAT superfamily N-acetyltransferase